ncbi:syndetin-like isoform X2 [Chenopodium quinoa]|uniref:syndetin-like isoform X2 n=1 Tax=Chenopodium quinoa TaxID=63459 RepID=UPI000B79021D|nr:syndetin-like isoform X2 [Chenopodium quinoa]
MQPGIGASSSSSSSPFSLSPLPFIYSFNGELSNTSVEGFDSSRVFFLASLWLFRGVGGGGSSGGSMDFSKVGEKILSSVRSARSLGFLPAASDRPEVPARAEAAAAVARALATLPPDQRLSLPSSSAELSSMYGSRSHDPVAEELEEEFYEEDFDPVMFVLEHIPSEDDELEHYETKATVRLAQLEKISAHLSRHVMEHHEEMVRGMQLVRELEKDLKIATVICMNGRRHLTSSMHEVSRDLVVTESSRKKQVLLDVLPVLTEILHALDMQKELETLVEEGNFCKAFQVLSEYLQLLDSLTELSAIQEMSRSVEVWLGNTLQKLDSLLLQVCQDFKEEKYVTVVDAYALIGDVSGLAEKIQSFFMQEVLSETHSVLKTTVQEDLDTDSLQYSSRLTYSDLCLQIPESKFRQCLLRTLAVLFRLMCSYHAIMSFQTENEFPVSRVQDNSNEQFDNSQKPVEVQSMSLGSGAYEYRVDNGSSVAAAEMLERSSTGEYASSSTDASGTNGSLPENSNDLSNLPLDDDAVSNSGSPWYELRRDATALVSQSLQRGCKNFWQLMTSRVSVLLSSAAFCSTSIHQFLKNYEDLNVYVLAGESFCGAEASEFRKKLKAACENYFSNFHKQNIYALKMVLEKESWQKLPRDAIQVVSFAGLVGDGAPLISSLDFGSMNAGLHQSNKLVPSGEFGSRKSGFSHWIKTGNPFLTKVSSPTNCHTSSPFVDGTSGSVEPDNSATGSDTTEKVTHVEININHSNGRASILDDENEDLLADFIDEDSQLPSRISKPHLPRNHSSQWRDDEAAAQTGSSLCLLRFMDKYARLMQKLEIVNVELFKGLCQFFEIYYYFVFDTFGHQDSCANGRGDAETLNHRLKTAVNRITQDCEQWLKPNLHYSSISMPVSLNSSSKNMDLTPTVPPGTNFGQSPGLKETCAAVDTVSLVASILRRSKAHLQSMLLQNNPTVVEDFFVFLVDSVPDLTEHIYRSTARLLLHINGYVERIANAKWEVKELGMEHNGYVDLLLGEFKHYRTRLAHAGIHKEVQELLLEYGVEIVAETLVEGLSRVKRCTDEGRALMSLDLQVLINGLQHFVSKDVKPKMHIVETFIKAYYLPETEYVYWARAHPEYTKSQVVGLVNLVATMKSWKRKTRLEVIEKIESSA